MLANNIIDFRDSNSGRRSTSDRRRHHTSMSGLYVGYSGERRSGLNRRVLADRRM